MWCSKCGKENEEGANFCQYCGNCLQENIYDYIERAKKNDQVALTELYRYSSPTIYKVVQVLIKDHDTVNDIIQDTYIKAFTRIDQLQNPNKLMPWLKMIATNTAKDWLKKNKPVLFSDMGNDETSDGQKFAENIEDESIDQNPELAADEKEVRRLVMEILDQLPEDQRLVIGMFYYEEMTVKDIASSLELSENTVKSRLSYARKKIKEQVLELERQGTRLYSVAPFAFFLYLLRAMQEAPADTADMAMLQQVMNTLGIAASGSQRQDDWNHPDSKSQTNGKGTSQPQTAETSMKRSATKSMAKSTAQTAVKQAAGATARHLSLKAVALVAAGIVGAGGATYAWLKNSDSLPFGKGDLVRQEETESERITLKETQSETQTESELQTEAVSEPESQRQTETESEIQSEIQTENQETEVPIPENLIAQGNYGDNVQWYLGEDGTLVLKGQGEIADALGQNPGWFDYADQIQKVDIGNGITRIGAYSFTRYDNLRSVRISDTVTEIGEYAFCECGLTELDLPDSVKKIGDMAFRRNYSLQTLMIGKNSQLETIGAQAFADNMGITSADISIPSTIQAIKSDAFPSGDFADTVRFSDQLKELGLEAFGSMTTGMHNVYFTGDAPNITDERIAKENATVFPDTTTDVYYPAGNVTWDGFDFSQLGVNVTPHSYDAEEKVIAIPQDATVKMKEKSESETTQGGETKATESTDEAVGTQSLYQDFYEKYISDENLQVLEDGYEGGFNREEGYTKDLLLAADVEDFGGDGNEELLIVRTRGIENEYYDGGGLEIKREINLELYGLDGQEVTMRQSMELPHSNLNDLLPNVIEQIAVQRTNDSCYLYRYAMYQPGHGAGSYSNSIIRINDQEMVSELDLDYTSFVGTYGECNVNGEDHYTGNADADIGYLNSVLQPYGLTAYSPLITPRSTYLKDMGGMDEMLNASCIMGLEREEEFEGDQYALHVILYSENDI